MKYNCIKVAFLILCLSGVSPVRGQRVYSLAECRSMALEHHVKMKLAVNNLKMAAESEKEAFTNYFPTVSATGAGFMADKGLLQMEMAPEMTLSMLKNGITGGITAVQPLFAGGRILNGNKLAAVGVEVSRLQMKQSENEVNLDTEQYYWQVVLLKEKLHTLISVEKMLDRLCVDVQVSVAAGITARNDLLQVQLKKNETASRKIKLENGLALSKMILAQHIGNTEETVDVEVELSCSEVPDSPELLRRNHKASLNLTAEYHLLEKKVEIHSLQKKDEAGKYLPSVAVGAGYIYDNLMDKNHSFGIAFATVSIPLSNWWGGSHAIRKQKLQVRNAELEKENSSELLVIRMQKSWDDLSDAYKQILLARESIGQAAENLRLNEEYYKAGTTSMSDLLDAQSLFRQTQDNYADAWAQYQIRKLEYLQATGD